jgi:hypothetical protein
MYNTLANQLELENEFWNEVAFVVVDDEWEGVT